MAFAQGYSIAAKMKKFVELRSVAFIGVSRSPMTIQGTTIDVLANLINYDYQSKIYPIYPQATEIQGLKTYTTMEPILGYWALIV